MFQAQRPVGRSRPAGQRRASTRTWACPPRHGSIHAPGTGASGRGRTADLQYTGRPRRANISPPTLAWPINACGLARSTLPNWQGNCRAQHLALLSATSPGRTQTTFPTTHITPACSSSHLTRRSHFGHDRRVTTLTQVLRADCHRCCGISTQATLSAADLTLARGGRDLAGTSLTRHLAQLTAITSRGPAHRCRIKLHQGHRRLGFSLGHPT